MRDCMKEVQLLIQSLWDCIWIKTQEEEETVNDIRELLKKKFPNMKLYLWSNTEGLKHIPVNKSEKAQETDIRLREVPALFGKIREQINSQDVSTDDTVYLLRDLNNLMADPRTRRCIRDIKEYRSRKKIYIVVLSMNDSIHEEVAPLFHVVDYPLPDKDIIRSLVKQANDSCAKKSEKDSSFIPLKDKDLGTIIDACVGLTAKEIEKLLFRSLVQFKTLSSDFLFQHKVQAIQKSGLLDFKRPQISLQDVGGHTVLKDWLLEVKELFKLEARKFGLAMPKGTLMLGIAGCGKTMMAEAFAGELKVPLLILNMARVMSSRVGQSEQQIEAALNIARASAPCAILLDELEKCIGGINSSNNSDSGVIARVFQSILRFLQDNDNGVYVMMTSNDVSQLPPELTRSGRIDAQWFFDLPQRDDRKDIFKLYFAKHEITIDDKNLELAADVSKNFTGAEIKEAVNNIVRKLFLKFQKTKRKSSVTPEDIQTGISEVTPVYDSNREKVQALRAWMKGRVRFTDIRREDQQQETFDPLNGGLEF